MDSLRSACLTDIHGRLNHKVPQYVRAPMIRYIDELEERIENFTNYGNELMMKLFNMDDCYKLQMMIDSNDSLIENMKKDIKMLRLFLEN